MSTFTQERGEYELFHMVARMVWEARRNDAIKQKYEDTDNSDLFPSTERLLKSLTQQAPNRIYFGPDGRVCRVLFFSENGLPYQARIETIELGDDPKIVKSEGISGRSIAALEQEITWWRRQFRMPGDLLTNPLMVLESTEEPGEIVHIGGIEKQIGSLVTVSDLVYCRYYQSSLNGPRFIDLGAGSDYKIRDEEFRRLDSPPAFILRHLNPFPATPYSFPTIS